MRTLIKALALAFLILPLARADVTVVVGRGVAAGPSATYLIKQGFEGAGYDNSETWTEIGGTPDEDDDSSPSPLDGVESLRMTTSSSTSQTQSPSYTSSTELWGYFMVHYVTAQALNRVFINVCSDASVVFELRRDSAGTVRIRHGTATATTSATLSQGTTYHIWWYWNDDSGPDDGVGRVWISTTSTKPASADAEITAGTATADSDNLKLGPSTSGTEVIVFDKVRVDDVEIGSSPE